MAQTTTLDFVSSDENGYVFYGQTDVTDLEDGKKEKVYHRTSLYPGQNIDGLPAEVVKKCNETWTPEVIAKYNEKYAA